MKKAKVVEKLKTIQKCAYIKDNRKVQKGKNC